MRRPGSAIQLVLARARRAWEQVRSSYWFIPSVMTAAAVGAAAVLLEVDRRVNTEWVTGIRWIYSGDASGARDVLSTIAGSMITVAGVTFSIIMVVLPLATQQYGPRLIRNFLRDPGTEIVLGTFIATFLYCILVLRAIRGDGAGEAFVPYLSVTAGVGTAVMSLAVLIYFIQHVAASIQVENLIHSAVRDFDHTAGAPFPAGVGQDAGVVAKPGPFQGEAPLSADGAVPYAVTAHRSGYIQHLDGTGLVQLAGEHDLVIELVRRPGDYVAVAEPVARLWGAGDRSRACADRVRDRLFIGRQRTPLHDILFAAERLTEIAMRALSPSTNDPYTAVNCIDELSGALTRYAARETPSAYRYDGEGRLRLVAVPVTFAEVVRNALLPLRLYGERHPSVLEALLRGIDRIGRSTTRPDVHAALRSVADGIVEYADGARLIDADLRHLRALHQVTVGALQA